MEDIAIQVHLFYEVIIFLGDFHTYLNLSTFCGAVETKKTNKRTDEVHTLNGHSYVHNCG